MSELRFKGESRSRVASRSFLGPYKIFVLFQSLRTPINNIICKHLLCLGTPPTPSIAHIIA